MGTTKYFNFIIRYSATKATLIAFFCTFFEFFNIPVFWPILVMYFITLFCITMKRQIKVNIKKISQLTPGLELPICFSRLENLFCLSISFFISNSKFQKCVKNFLIYPAFITHTTIFKEISVGKNCFMFQVLSLSKAEPGEVTYMQTTVDFLNQIQLEIVIVSEGTVKFMLKSDRDCIYFTKLIFNFYKYKLV